MKTKIDISKEQINKNDRERDKATTVFAILYAKRKGKYTGWSDAKAETIIPSKSDIRNEMELINN